jgi:hypothetical protein
MQASIQRWKKKVNMIDHSEISEQDETSLYGEAQACDPWMRRYAPWIALNFTVIFAIFLLAMNLAGQVPGKSFVLKSVSDIIQFAGEGIGCFFCVRIAIRLRRVYARLRHDLIAKEIGRQVATHLAADRAETQAAYRAYLAWTLLAIAIALYATGQAIWTSYDIRMNSANVPFPGLYDLAFVASYPFFLSGTLLLTRRGKALVKRSYLLIDALAVIGASLALSWFFLLGPSIASLTHTPGPGVAFLSLYFPTGDLFLVALGALLMFSPLSNRAQQPVFLLLCSGLFFLAITDSFLGYYNFSGGFNTGTLQDVLWPLSMQLIGLAAISYPDSIAREQAEIAEATKALTPGSTLPASAYGNQLTALVLTILPLSLVLTTCALLLLRIIPQGGAISIQAEIVVLVLVLVLIARQALTLLENNRLITQIRRELDLSQRELHIKRREAEEALRRAQEKMELEEGVAALRLVLTRVVRGDFSMRVPAISGPLQQIAVSLNMMMDQLNSNVQQSTYNKQVGREVKIVQEAIERFEQGLSPWIYSQPPSPSTSEMRTIFFSLQRAYTNQVGHWRSLKSSLDAGNTLATHLRQTLSKVKSSRLFSFNEQSHTESMVIDGAIHEAMMLEQQQQLVLKQVAEFSTNLVSSTSQMPKSGAKS